MQGKPGKKIVSHLTKVPRLLFNRSKGNVSGCTAAQNGMHCYIHHLYRLTPPNFLCSDNTQNLHKSTVEWISRQCPHPRWKCPDCKLIFSLNTKIITHYMYKPHNLPLTDLGSRVLMHILVCTSYICILGSEPATAYLSRSPLRVEHRDCLASLVVCKQAPVVKCHNFTMPEASTVK